MKNKEKKLKTIQECIDLHYINDEDFIRIYEFNDDMMNHAFYGSLFYQGKAKYAYTNDYHVLKILHFQFGFDILVMPLEREKTPFIDWE